LSLSISTILTYLSGGFPALQLILPLIVFVINLAFMAFMIVLDFDQRQATRWR
jgi:hypothetical protein